jgi:4'-phosphopantetheinyl transferase
VAALSLLTPAARPPLPAGLPLLWLHRLPTARDHAAAHTLLRETLADYLACSAPCVPLRCVPGQAPWLEMDAPLALSLSYADEMLLLGLCAGARLGVDLVRITPMPDWREVATLYLGPVGCTALAALPASERDPAFARAWAELEARSKCLGEGLAEWTPAAAARRAQCLHAERGIDGMWISAAWCPV